MDKQVDSSSIPNNIHEPSIFYFEIPSFENGKPTPRLGDIWTPTLDVTVQCYIKSYMPSIEEMFKIGDIIIKVEHFKTMSWTSSWKLYVGNGWVKENLESIDFAMSLDQEKFYFDLYMQ